MFWIGALTLMSCMFAIPQRSVEGLQLVEPHTFLNLKENCTCCHESGDNVAEIEPHLFTVDIIASCLGCHTREDLGKSHPIGDETDTRGSRTEIPADLPLDDSGRITCGTCHNPHLPAYLNERFSSRQAPAGMRNEDGQVVAYYKSYRLRRHTPEAGNDPTCAGCHSEYF